MAGRGPPGGPRRLEDHSIRGLGRKREVIMFGGAPSAPVWAWGLSGSEEGGGSVALTFWYGWGWAPRDMVSSLVIANPVNVVPWATKKFYTRSAQAGGLGGQLKGSTPAQPQPAQSLQLRGPFPDDPLLPRPQALRGVQGQRSAEVAQSRVGPLLWARAAPGRQGWRQGLERRR